MYWPPIYRFICRRGYASPDAQDLTQKVSLLYFLRTKAYTRTDQPRGKFRRFLACVGGNISWRMIGTALKRSGVAAKYQFDVVRSPNGGSALRHRRLNVGFNSGAFIRFAMGKELAGCALHTLRLELRPRENSSFLNN